jgi:aspartyl-tRNA(Asn)/glutamyl-tRNA(Gln) amidotransferase subunit A
MIVDNCDTNRRQSMSDLSQLSACDLLDRFADRSLSPVDVAEASLARIADRDRSVNAFCFLDAEATLAMARASEQRWLRNQPAGLLDGVPVAVKDVFLTRDWPTRRGSALIDVDQPWPDDAPAVAALRRNGAVLVGKTTTPELGWKGVTDSAATGVTGNPWDPSRTAGGSSGGSAAAVAMGMAPLALGTDGGGSIRIPAGFCGLVGHKPTYGRVPLWPASPYGTLSHAGPMAWTVADAALLLDVLAEPDYRDATQLPPAPSAFRHGLDAGVGGLRIAYSPNLGYVDVDPEVAALVSAATTVFEQLGNDIEQADPGFDDPVDLFDILWNTGAAAATAGFGQQERERMDPGLVEIIDDGARYSGVDVAAASTRRGELGALMGAFHERYDLLVTPTLPLTAFEAGREVPPGWRRRRWTSWTPFSYPFNLTQQPAVSVPCGFTAAGLPVGLQIVGPRHADQIVLRAAHAYQTEHPLTDRRPS